MSHNWSIHSLLAFCLWGTATCAIAADPAASERAGMEFFESNVRPLLAKHCYSCHSAKAEDVKGGLLLDSRVGWQVGGDSGAAIEPGDPDASLLIEAVRYQSLEMPPVGKLADSEVAALEKWVRLGAPDPRDATPTTRERPAIDLEAARDFWAFQLPEAHRPPSVRKVAWPRDEIDCFILAGLEQRQIEPAPDADNATWLRRITFDLTGLPPTLAELDAFAVDASPEAREKVVDRLLASPEFGVHWGRHWLDVARYADSNGSDFNATFFNAWRYRNYVIAAFNADKPFDQFIRQQLAGDLLPAASDEQREEQLIATTFLMIGSKMLSERDKQKLVMDTVDEQIDTIGRAFLGLTLGCARCHDHKFDPVPTHDYYALAGIFRSTITLEGESQQYVSTWVETPLPVPSEVKDRIERHNQEVEHLKAQLLEAKDMLAESERQLAGLKLAGQGMIVDDADAAVVGMWKSSQHSPHYVGKSYLHDEKENKGEKSITWTAKLPEPGKYEVRISFAGGNGRDKSVPVTIRHAGGTTELKIDQTKVPPIDKLFLSLGEFEFAAEASVTVSNAGTTDYVIADSVQFLPLSEMSESSVAQPVDAEFAAAKETVRQLAENVKRMEAETKKREENAPHPPTAMAAREAPQIEDCQVCIRGESDRLGETIQRGFLRVVSDADVRIENKQESGRRELADWISRADHPLTARVIVNRIWQHMFGEGLVASVDNFGHLGQRPSHPGLLDTLAVEFAQSGWRVKSLIRRLALSRTYAMSTRFDARAYEIDPENRLPWRADRKRLPAEALRDSMLAFAGRLDLSQAESPVSGLGKLAINNASQGESGRRTDSQRRSIYLPIVRNDLPRILTLFDFADPDLVTGRRPTTNVPAQALFLLNDPFVKEQASATADRLLAEGASDEKVVDAAYRLVLSRPPSADQRKRVLSFLRETTGGDPSQRKQAWSQVILALLASTEFRMLE